jgi:hypothetical protein
VGGWVDSSTTHSTLRCCNQSNPGCCTCCRVNQTVDLCSSKKLPYLELCCRKRISVSGCGAAVAARCGVESPHVVELLYALSWCVDQTELHACEASDCICKQTSEFTQMVCKDTLLF